MALGYPREKEEQWSPREEEESQESGDHAESTKAEVGGNSAIKANDNQYFLIYAQDKQIIISKPSKKKIASK